MAAGLVASTLTAGAAVARPLDGTWSDTGEIDGIKVFKKLSDETGTSEFRSKMVIPADIATLSAALIDGANFSQWIEGCVESKVVEEQVSRDPQIPLASQYSITYGVNTAPWPLKQRDYAVRSTMDIAKDDASAPISVAFRSELISTPKAPENSKRVRVKKMLVNVVLTPVAGDPKATEVDFGLSMDPDVSGPASVVEAVSRENPPKTLLKLKEFSKALKFDPQLVNTIKERLARTK